MTHLEQRAFDLAAKLNCYASGDGSLSFVWTRYNLMTGNREAIGEPVTMEDARAFMQSIEWSRPTHEVWRLLELNGMPCVYQPVKRVAPDAVVFPGSDRVYHYLKHSEQWFEVWTHDPDGERIEVENLSMKARIRFFVNNEAEVNK